MGIILSDDHQIIKAGLRKLIKLIDPKISVSTVATGLELEEKIKSNRFDVAILDIVLPDFDPVSFLYWVKSIENPPRILFFSMCSEAIFGKRLIKLGAHGFVNKSENEEVIINAIKTVLNGGVYMSQSLKEQIINESIYGKNVGLLSSLSDREMEIMNLLVRGESTSSISNSLNLHKSTVATHKKRIFDKLGTSNIAELIQLYTIY